MFGGGLDEGEVRKAGLGLLQHGGEYVCACDGVRQLTQRGGRVPSPTGDIKGGGEKRIHAQLGVNALHHLGMNVGTRLRVPVSDRRGNEGIRHDPD